MLTPVVKAVVFASATVAWYDVLGPVWAAGFLVVTVVVNGLAQLPGVRRLAAA